MSEVKNEVIADSRANGSAPWSDFEVEKTGDAQYDAGAFLLAAAQEFWDSCRKVGQYGAVQWLIGDGGELLLYTRGEYKDALLLNIHKIDQPVRNFTHQDDPLARAQAAAKVFEDVALTGTGMMRDGVRIPPEVYMAEPPATHADLLEAPPMPKRRVPSYHTYNDEDIQAINAIWAERVRVALGMGREAGIEEAAQVAERCYVKDAFKFELGVEAAAAIRALATQPAASAVELSDGLDPDLHINDVFRDIPYRALLAKQAAQSPVAPPKNCRESHPGSGFCVKCSEGLYGECLYRQRQFSPVVGRDADQWQPIETAPKDGTRIQIKFKSGNTHEANWRATYGGEWHVDSYEFLPWADQQDITHWRPLLVETIDAAINSKEG